jgi:hypothetical protein
MKSEFFKTAIFAAGALAFVAAASWIQPDAYRAEIYSDTGEIFFPRFTSAAMVKAVEIVDYDEAEAAARPLKVEFRGNRWILSSHSDYPAEARNRLARTAAALIDLKKDQAVSDRVEDHANFDVLDPLDAKSASLSGRGKLVTLRDGQGATLAALILGKPVKEKTGFRYVRAPGQKRTYAVKTDADPSARFEDWVEADLLRIGYNEIAKLTLNSYRIDETMGRLVNPRRLIMVKDKENWDQQARSMANAVGSLRVVGTRPKPPMLAQQLRSGELALTLDVVMSLRQKGFFISPTGQLLANEGELTVETAKGLVCTLRFGEIVAEAATGPRRKDDRYLFVTASSRNPETESLARTMQNKFADWYYVISGADFARLHPQAAAAKGELPVRPSGLPPSIPPEILRQLQQREAGARPQQ